MSTSLIVVTLERRSSHSHIWRGFASVDNNRCRIVTLRPASQAPMSPSHERYLIVGRQDSPGPMIPIYRGHCFAPSQRFTSHRDAPFTALSFCSSQYERAHSHTAFTLGLKCEICPVHPVYHARGLCHHTYTRAQGCRPLATWRTGWQKALRPLL